jgi:hypothetical protein
LSILVVEHVLRTSCVSKMLFCNIYIYIPLSIIRWNGKALSSKLKRRRIRPHSTPYRTLTGQKRQI